MYFEESFIEGSQTYPNLEAAKALMPSARHVAWSMQTSVSTAWVLEKLATLFFLFMNRDFILFDAELHSTQSCSIMLFQRGLPEGCSNLFGVLGQRYRAHHDHSHIKLFVDKWMSTHNTFENFGPMMQKKGIEIHMHLSFVSPAFALKVLCSNLSESSHFGSCYLAG